MDAILPQIVTGLDKGSAYAMIALGLTLIFGTLGVVNFAHGTLFMIGAFCAIVMQRLLNLESITLDEETLTPWGTATEIRTPYAEAWFGDFGSVMVDWSVPFAIILTIPVMLVVGLIMERGLIKHFYKRPHADQILVTFGLAVVLQEVIKKIFGTTGIQTPAPTALATPVDIGVWFGLAEGYLTYNAWRLVYFVFSLSAIGAVFAFLNLTTFGMVVRAGMADRETVGLLGIDIDRRFTLMFGLAAVVTGLAGMMYAPIVSPNYHTGLDFLVISFVVVVVGGMGSLGGAVAAGFLLGVVQSLAAMPAVTEIFRGIDQIIIYLVAVIVLLTRPRGLMGRKGVMES